MTTLSTKTITDTPRPLRPIMHHADMFAVLGWFPLDVATFCNACAPEIARKFRVSVYPMNSWLGRTMQRLAALHVIHLWKGCYHYDA